MKNTYLDSGNMADCCGCRACVECCPKNAISMVEMADKCNYPVINRLLCINCGKCRTVCPVSYEQKENNSYEQKVYMAVLKNEDERNLSASGGAFHGIVMALQKRNPRLLVAGALWNDDLEVVHKLLPSQEHNLFRKSKYVQSDCTGVYKDCEAALESGGNVLFSGTPCQVAALKAFLGKDYENLFTVDIVCHGVAGFSAFSNYIAEKEKKYRSKVTSVTFRYKKKDLYGEIHSDYLKLDLQSGKTYLGNKKTDPYLRAFHSGALYRESCYECPFAKLDRNSDLTLCDYWHIQKLFDKYRDYTGVSAVLVNSQKGFDLIQNACDLDLIETEVSFLYNHNGQLRGPAKRHRNREQLLSEFESVPFSKLVDKHVGKAKYVKHYISSLLPAELKKKIK